MSAVAFWSSFAGKSSPSAIIDPPSRRSSASLSFTSFGSFPAARKPPAIGIFNPPSSRIQAIAGEIPHETEAICAEPINKHLKQGLIDFIAGTNRGLTTTSETRAEVSELVAQLEAENPNPAPTEALYLLDGKWIVAYASSAGFWPAAAKAAGRLPQVVKVDEISVTIDTEALTVRDSVRFVGPFSSTSLTANAKFQVRGPKRVQITYVEGIIGAPQLTDHPSIPLPEKLEFFGRSIDLSPFKGALSSLQGTAASVAKAVSTLPQVKVPIPASQAETWSVTTYLDDDLRISRGDGCSLFVLIKEGSPLLDQLISH